MMASPERLTGLTTFDNKISTKQLHNVVHTKVRIQNEKAKQQDSIRRARDQFEKQMNQEAKVLLKKVKVPMAGTFSAKKTTTNDLKLPDINTSGNNSTPSSPLLKRDKPSSARAPQSLSVLLPPSGPRRGSVNNIDSLHVPSSPLVNRRGSFHGTTDFRPSLSQSPLSSPLLDRRRMTLGVVPSLNVAKPGPTTKHLAVRQLRRGSIISSTSPPPSPPEPSALEDQFKALESCRYLR